jgi:hypothetical protein
MFIEIVNEYIEKYENKLIKLKELQTILSPPVLIKEFISTTKKVGAGWTRFNLNNKTKRSSNSKKYNCNRNKSNKHKQV